MIDRAPEIAGAAHTLLARIYLNTHPDKALTHREQAESLLPHTADGYALRALTAATPAEARQWLNQALQLDARHYETRKARALVYYGLKDYARMLPDVEAIIVMRPQDSLGYALRALARHGLGELPEALSDHTRAIELCETDWELPALIEQRQETYWRMGDYQAALLDAQRCVNLAPETPAYRVALGRVLFKLGHCADAGNEFSGIWAEAWPQIIKIMLGYAYEAAQRGEPVGVPESLQQTRPFNWMMRYVDFYQGLEQKATRLVQGSFDVSSWSPDGKQLAYTRSEFCGWDDTALTRLGPSSPVVVRGIEVLDLESGRTRTVTTFGASPVWSPDGSHIAFVRSHDLFTEENAEIWLIPATGGEPKRLAEGGSPGWTGHPTRLYYHSRGDNSVCYIDVVDSHAKSVRVAHCPGLYPQVSPDERYLAYATAGELTVVDLASGERVVKWVIPGPEQYCAVRWSPNGREISLSALGRCQRRQHMSLVFLLLRLSLHPVRRHLDGFWTKFLKKDNKK